MRLIKDDKAAFVRAVIDDIPTINYDDQVRSKMKAFGLSTLPPDLKDVAVKYPGYFETRCLYTPNGCPNVNVICHIDLPNYSSSWKEKYPEIWAELKEIGKLNEAQNDARKAMGEKLRAIIDGCSTLKVAKERLPEFEKYLPADRDGHGTTNLPVANVVADLMNLGWPKDAPLKGAACA